MKKDLYSTEEAAEVLKVSPSRVRQMIMEGMIKPVKVGKISLIPAAQLEKARGRKTKPGPLARSTQLGKAHSRRRELAAA
jgi:excisionase family DNA binding protein